jgi:chemotaxis protein MotA
MKSIIGMLVVLVAVIAGYLMEHGNLSVLFQPAELVIIFGASIGALIVASPGSVLSLVMKNVGKAFTYKSPSKETYMDLLLLLYELFSKARREGIISLEGDIEHVDQSEIFNRHKSVIADQQVLDYIRDNLRVIVMGVQPQDVIELVEIDIESKAKEGMIPSQSIGRVADGLPGLGIVAAVLGVVLTMGKITEPPEVLGHSIGAALVGTFLGVLCCYGFVGPLSACLEHIAKERTVYFHVIKTAIQRFDSNPTITIETARREIPSSERPSFKEMDEMIKQWKTKK